MIATLLCCALGAAPELPWELVTEEDGIRVWQRAIANSPVPVLRAQTIVNQPAERVWHVVSNVEAYGEFMPYVVDVRVLAEDGQTRYVYFLLDPPVVNRRDYIMKTSLFPEPEKGVWLRTWTLANARGPAPPDGVVRLELNDGSWHLEKLGSRSTLVTYRVHSHPGGSVPDWIARKAATTSVPDLMRAVRARSRDHTWTPD